MTQLKALETKLASLFKDAPALPENSREALAKAWPYLALIFGLLQFAAAWALYALITAANRTLDIITTQSVYVTGQTYGISGTEKIMIYLGLLVLLIDGVILLMAYAPLSRRERRGWDLLFLGSVLNATYALITLFIGDRGISSFIFNMIGSLIGFYLLFQVQGKFGGKTASVPTPKADPSDNDNSATE